MYKYTDSKYSYMLHLNLNDGSEDIKLTTVTYNSMKTTVDKIFTDRAYECSGITVFRIKGRGENQELIFKYEFTNSKYEELFPCENDCYTFDM